MPEIRTNIRAAAEELSSNPRELANAKHTYYRGVLAHRFNEVTADHLIDAAPKKPAEKFKVLQSLCTADLVKGVNLIQLAKALKEVIDKTLQEESCFDPLERPQIVTIHLAVDNLLFALYVQWCWRPYPITEMDAESQLRLIHELGKIFINHDRIWHLAPHMEVMFEMLTYWPLAQDVYRRQTANDGGPIRDAANFALQVGKDFASSGGGLSGAVAAGLTIAQKFGELYPTKELSTTEKVAQLDALSAAIFGVYLPPRGATPATVPMHFYTLIRGWSGTSSMKGIVWLKLAEWMLRFGHQINDVDRVAVADNVRQFATVDLGASADRYVMWGAASALKALGDSKVTVLRLCVNDAFRATIEVSWDSIPSATPGADHTPSPTQSATRASSAIPRGSLSRLSSVSELAEIHDAGIFAFAASCPLPSGSPVGVHRPVPLTAAEIARLSAAASKSQSPDSLV